MKEMVWRAGRAVWRRLKKREPVFLSPVRRLSRVYPPAGQRVVAMTFDDGPTLAPLRPPGREGGITETLLAILAEAGARGTFDVIGSTAENYPDSAGRPGSPFWSGRRYDHYPAFGRDKEAGVANLPDLAREMVRQGHELANHGFRHLALGPSPLVYRGRRHWPGWESAWEDLRRLHDLVLAVTGATMVLARPPHYVDRLPDGFTAYDLYQVLGYQYLAASWDGGGWRPSGGDYRQDVEAMVEPLARVLARDAGALNGQIIFHKDGYNMSGQSPVVDALPRHLRLLRENGYRVVTVSDLMALSPLQDLAPSHPWTPWVRHLLAQGYCLAYRDNTLRPLDPLRRGEMVVMFLPPSCWRKAACDLARRKELLSRGRARYRDVPPSHPYWFFVERAHDLGLLSSSGETLGVNEPVGPREAEAFLSLISKRLGMVPSLPPGSLPDPPSPGEDRHLTRLGAIALLCRSGR